ncbi:MAG: hypothetical protein A2Y70_03035 [Candidatus Aminicenantes bacterium RBG_13_64_14]|nr:MAG: hypothetical protein A2Y70_03035 [Candidatus Aminicenantes bacterium RBG_13_64_14]
MAVSRKPLFRRKQGARFRKRLPWHFGQGFSSSVIPSDRAAASLDCRAGVAGRLDVVIISPI